MNELENILKYIDNLMMQETQSNLAPVEEAILTGVWQNQSYSKIATGFNCSESLIKKEAAKLWKKLSPVLGEEINSDNFIKEVEKKYRVSQGDNFGYCVQVNEGYIICDKTLQKSENIQQQLEHFKTENQTTIIDLKLELNSNNYGRNREITTLKQWILENQTKLMTIYGLSGIGKTALTLKLISEIQENFDYIIHRCLNKKLELIKLENDLKQFFNKSKIQPLSEIIDYLKSYRCLLILDDVQNIFKTGHLAGQYLPEFKDYSKFFQDIATLSHRSSVMLISWEKLGDLEVLECDNQAVKSLHLMGLGEDSKEILKQKGLKDEEKWNELINLYQGHPHWLNIVSLTILNVCDGEVAQFLSDEDDLFLGDIKSSLENHFERLSELEKNIINWLVNQEQLLYINSKSDSFEPSKPKNFKLGIQSLIRRGLVEKIMKDNTSYFQINAIFKAYIQENLSR
jgi:NB-ARC domain